MGSGIGKMGSPKGKGKGKSTYLAQEGEMEDGNIPIEVIGESGGVGSEGAPVEPLAASDSPGGGETDPRDAYYANDSVPETWMTFFARSPVNAIDHLTGMQTGEDRIWRAKTVNRSPLPILIDSGASGAAVGLRWLKRRGGGGPAATSIGEKAIATSDSATELVELVMVRV